MSEDKVELGRRVVACKGWQWMPGMRTINGRRLAVVFGLSRTASVLCDLRDDANSDTEELQGELPDLADPATLGCLLALVRESEGCAVITSPDYDEDETGCQGLNVTGWRAIETVRWMPVGEGATEAEALVAALEGAP